MGDINLRVGLEKHGFLFFEVSKSRSTVMLVGFFLDERAGVSPVARIL